MFEFNSRLLSINSSGGYRPCLKFYYVFSGSEFDMMSRKVIAASSLPVAKRIAQVVRAFPCARDDECLARMNSNLNGPCPLLH